MERLELFFESVRRPVRCANAETEKKKDSVEGEMSFFFFRSHSLVEFFSFFSRQSFPIVLERPAFSSTPRFALGSRYVERRTRSNTSRSSKYLRLVMLDP